MQMWSGAVSGVAGESEQIALCDRLSDFDRSFRQMSVTDDHAIAAVHIDTDAVAAVPTGLYDGSGGAALDRRADIDREVDSVVRSAPARTDGTKVEVCIGEKDDDPVFCISDLLPHLGAKQNAKTLAEGITAEELNVIIASLPIADKDAEQRVKLNVLGMLNEAYGITERDFTRAEIEVVPAHKARDIGLDRAMIGAYGHDDRVDAYPALMAEIETKTPAYTSVCVLTDKEETGSDGVTGLNSMYTFHFLQQLCAGQGADYITACKAAKCLSADVTAAFDPTFADAFEPDNSTYAGCGVAIYKYTGSRGKSGTSDASAEMVSYLTGLMDKNNVIWQIGEMGKLDLGGGGTVAKYVANQDIDTIDIGVPVISMHSPFEIVSKADVYMAYLTFKAFCEDSE